MGSTSSLIEDTENALNTPRYMARSTKLPHQDTCESDVGMMEDIGKIMFLFSEMCNNDSLLNQF